MMDLPVRWDLYRVGDERLLLSLYEPSQPYVPARLGPGSYEWRSTVGRVSFEVDEEHVIRATATFQGSRALEPEFLRPR